jgi:hypothetical protein
MIDWGMAGASIIRQNVHGCKKYNGTGMIVRWGGSGKSCESQHMRPQCDWRNTIIDHESGSLFTSLVCTHCSIAGCQSLATFTAKMVFFSCVQRDSRLGQT